MNIAMDHATQNATALSARTTDPDWWRGAVIYQIYPRSFQDTSGDGVGDLNGITQRLPYVAALGVDAIWISPFFTSPMKDFGYDVSDYRDVDAMFGTLHDFDLLVAEAHRLGLKVMIDLVISHTSSQHPWFVESRSSRDNPKADWYVWADARPDGTPPNNWLSIFGGSSWQWDPTRLQYYLHNFLTSQPDLNFHNPDVQDALLDMTRYWLQRGVDGFRLDTINFYFHDKELRDNPPLDPALRNASIAPAVNPYNWQNHIRDKNQPENLDFLKRFRAVMDEFPAIAAVGEVGDAQYGLQIVADYTAGNDKMHMCYAFDFLSGEALTPQKVAEVIARFGEGAPEAWACWAFSNHDVVRHGTRWAVSTQDHAQEKYLRLLAGVLLTLRGSACLYQGEELGLTEADIAFEDLQDPYGIEFWPDFKGRDGCRTPMVWEAGADHGGFSNGQPWLPVPPEHRARAVDAQDRTHASMLNHYRGFLAFRREHAALIKGEMSLVAHDGNVLAYTRSFGNETILCVFNFGAAPKIWTCPDLALDPLEGHGYSGMLGTDGAVELPPYDAFFARVG
jgi:alpha-glucosidase